MQIWARIRKSKLLKIVLLLSVVSFVLNLLQAYGVIEDKTRDRIPKPLEAHKLVKRVGHSSFPGGSATVSIYELDRKSIRFLNSNISFLDNWTPGKGCVSAMIFLRDIGNGKDEKVRWYFENHQVYGQKSAMLIPERGLVIVCDADW